VVDNASTNDSVKRIKTKYPWVNLIENTENLKFAGGNNTGISQALKDGAGYILLLNNDTVVAPDLIETMYQGTIAHGFDIASPKIYFYPGKEFHHQDYREDETGRVIWYAGGRIDWANVWPSHLGVDEVDHGQFDRTGPTEFATGCAMLINNKVFKQTGLLDPVYNFYFEDTDFCLKAKKHGFNIGYIGTSSLWHKNAGSTGGSGSKRQKKYIDRSRLIFAMRYAPVRAKLALLKLQLKTLITN
jgi:GT2 family glycosyltransferase